MSNKIHILEYLEKSKDVLIDCITNADMIATVEVAAEEMVKRLKDGQKIISIGNGGSMSDAMHFASELSGRYKETRSPIAAMAISDPGAMSCIANDFGYEFVFSRQVIAVGEPRDILLAFSTSGKSLNVIRAMDAAQKMGMIVIGITGIHSAKEFTSLCDICIKIPSNETGRIQETTIMIIHLLVELIETSLP